MLTTRLALTASCIALGTCLAMPTSAQDSVNDEERKLDTVMVTATKRAETLQNVPVAVSARSGEDLEKSGVSSIEGLATLVPSLTFTQSSNDLNSSVRIRGVGTEVFSSGVEPSVSFVIDDVVLARQGQGFQDLVDVERVEVLRGPQSTLFGKNASAGVISVTTQAPTDTMTGKLDATIAEGDEYALRGTLAGPLSDTVSGRLTAFTKSLKGHIKNAPDGRDLNGYDNWGVRGKLLIEPGNALDLTFIADYRDTQQDCCAYQIRDTSTALNPVVGATLDALLDPVIASPENRQTNLNAPVYNNSEQWGMSGKAEYMFDNGFTFTSITAYREWDFENNIDVDALNFEDPIPGVITFDLNSGQTSLSQTSQEFRLASPEWDHFDFMIGAYLFDLDLDRSFRRRLEAMTALGIAGQSGQFNGSVGNKNYAVFASGNLRFGQGTTLFGGLRLIDETLEYQVFRDPANTLQPGDFPLGGTAGTPADIDGETSDTALVGNIGLRHQWNDDVMTYVRYARGYKGRAFDVIFTAPQDTEPVNAELSDSYEAGLKVQTPNSRLQFNAAVFWTEYTDFQAQERDVAASTIVVANAGEVSTKGLELDASALLTDTTLLQGGIAYTDAKVESFPFAQCYRGQSEPEGCVNGAQDLSGEDLPNSPDWRFTASLRQDIPLSSQVFDGFIQLDGSWQSEVQFQIDQNPNTVQDGYGLLHLSAGIEDEDGAWSASVFVRNLLDETYAANVFSDPLYAGVISQYLPRDSERYVGARLTASF
ncbi:TonB-dependent receptor [Hyphomonas oceanitis]|nr:TonB-dependent receptor [Hyphomonas oceanitis]